MNKPKFWLSTIDDVKLQEMLEIANAAISDGVSVVSFTEIGTSTNFMRNWNPLEMADWLSEELVFRGIIPQYSRPVKGAIIINPGY